MSRKSVRLYIEGGAVGRNADADFRRGWKNFLRRELESHAHTHNFATIEVVRGTGRQQTYNDFLISRKKHPEDLCVLLVDSETIVPPRMPVWSVVKQREGDKWDKPDWATDQHLYLMVIAVEAWLLTDQTALAKYFKRGFDVSRLPTTNLETRSKTEIDSALKRASKNCKCGPYRHGMAHEIVELVDSEKVKTLPHCARLFFELKALIRAVSGPPRGQGGRL